MQWTARQGHKQRGSQQADTQPHQLAADDCTNVKRTCDLVTGCQLVRLSIGLKVVDKIVPFLLHDSSKLKHEQPMATIKPFQLVLFT